MSIPALARLCRSLLDELGHRGGVDVLGFSLGGLIAQQLAWSAPGHVRRLVLMSTNMGWGSMPSDPRTFGNLFSLRRLHDAEEFSRSAPALLGGEMRRDPELVRRAAQSRIEAPQEARGYVWQLLACASWTVLPFLPLIRSPTLIVHGDDDPLARMSNARVMARLIPGAHLHVVHGAGHYLVLERPHEVAEVLRDFLVARERSGV
jgi:pimeloyl-ACP methyl ester carboxylesterase